MRPSPRSMKPWRESWMAPTFGNPSTISTSCAKMCPVCSSSWLGLWASRALRTYCCRLSLDTQADYGRLGKARQLSAQAEESAKRNASKETAAFWQGNAALREAEFGNAADALKQARAALDLAPGRDVKVEAALASARGGDVTSAEKLVDALHQEFPLDTLMQNYWIPTVRAAIALQRHDSTKAIGILQASVPYELADPPPFSAGTMYPVYLRGQAYLAAGNAAANGTANGAQAAAEFQKILDHPGVLVNFPLSALSH